MTWAFGPRDWRTVAVVEEPDAKASACPPPSSSEASVRSRALRLGFEEREYSKPCGRVGL